MNYGEGKVWERDPLFCFQKRIFHRFLKSEQLTEPNFHLGSLRLRVGEEQAEGSIAPPPGLLSPWDPSPRPGPRTPSAFYPVAPLLLFSADRSLLLRQDAPISSPLRKASRPQPRQTCPPRFSLSIHVPRAPRPQHGSLGTLNPRIVLSPASPLLSVPRPLQGGGQIPQSSTLFPVSNWLPLLEAPGLQRTANAGPTLAGL